MNTNELRCMLTRDKKTKEMFIDVFAIDQFKRFVKKNSLVQGLYLINDENSKENGNHWFLIFHDKNILVFVDSFANNYKYYGLEKEVYNVNKIEEVPFRLQDYFSDVCGEYTIFFAYHLCRGKRLQNIIKYFTHTHHDNDEKIRYFVPKKFPGHKR